MQEKLATENTQRGLIIRTAREIAGMTQAELADRLAVSSNSVCSWEKGDAKPSVKHWSALCDLLKIPPDIIGADHTINRKSARKFQLMILQNTHLCPKCQPILEAFINKYYRTNAPE